MKNAVLLALADKWVNDAREMQRTIQASETATDPRVLAEAETLVACADTLVTLTNLLGE